MKKSKLLITSAILGVLYSIYIITYFYNSITGSDSYEAIGASIASMLVMPHMLTVLLAAVFSVVAVLTNKQWSGLTAMILYFVSAVLFIPYAVFSIPIAVFALFGWIKMKKLNQQVKEVVN